MCRNDGGIKENNNKIKALIVLPDPHLSVPAQHPLLEKEETERERDEFKMISLSHMDQFLLGIKPQMHRKISVQNTQVFRLSRP